LFGNATTASVLQTTRTLWGRNFNGSANITGSLIIDSTNNEANYLGIQRTADAGQEVRHSLEDTVYRIKYTNDENTSAINVQFISTDTETGGGVSASNHTVVFTATQPGVSLSLPGTSTITATTFSGTATQLNGGTANYIPLWTSATLQSSSNIFQSSGNIGIGTTSPGARLHVQGNVSASSYTGSLFGNATTATSASFATTASAATSITFTPVSASFAATASFVNILNQTVSASGNIAGTYLISNNSTGDEGGEILLAKPQTNTTLVGTGITLDVYQNRLRIFEQGGTARGGYWDITTLGAGASTNLTGGSGTVTSVTAGSGLTGGTITGAGTITLDTGSAHFTGGVAKVLVTSASFATTSSFATTASFAPTILPSGIVSSSSQVSYTGLSNIPSGIV
jgi:hypothetical protein